MFKSTGYFIRICIYINSSSAMSDSFFNLHCVVVVASKLLYRPRHEEISHGRRTYTIILDKTQTFHVFENFSSPQMKRNQITYYHQKVNVRVASGFPSRLKILGNQEISRRSLKYYDLIVSTHPAIPKANFDICARKSQIIISKTFLKKTYFIQFCEFPCYLLSRIVLFNICLTDYFPAVGVRYIA